MMALEPSIFTSGRPDEFVSCSCPSVGEKTPTYPKSQLGNFVAAGQLDGAVDGERHDFVVFLKRFNWCQWCVVQFPSVGKWGAYEWEIPFIYCPACTST